MAVKLTKAQRECLEVAALSGDGSVLAYQFTRQVGSLAYRGLLMPDGKNAMGRKVYRITGAGRDALAQSNAPKRKRCGTSGCAEYATHKGSSGLFAFYLCAEHASTAREPPLRCTSVVPL